MTEPRRASDDLPPPAFPRKRTSGVPGYAISLALTGLVTLLGTAIFARGNIANVGLLFLLPVMVAATRYGLRTAIVTALASTLAYNFFFIPPTHTFSIENPQNIITVLVLLGVAVAASQLAARVREQALLAEASAAQNGALAGFARQVTGISASDQLARVLCRDTALLLGCRTVLLMPDAADVLTPCASCPDRAELGVDDLAAARAVLAHAAGPRPASAWLFRPLGTGDPVLAVLGLARSDGAPPVPPEQESLLAGLVDQAAQTLERIRLEQEMAALAHVRERDRLRQALLSSVSHDLRTPLTTILGSLRELRPLSGEQEDRIVAVRAEADRLKRFVDNLLDMVRIEAGALDQTIEPVDLAEAAASAVHDSLAVLADRPVVIDMPASLPLVMVDPQLFHHCLINLIDNAARHGDPESPVTIAARRDGGDIVLSVKDRGPGIPEGEAGRIFETFARIAGSDRSGGTGLGLAIVKGFAEAMGLGVSAANRDDAPGACFTIRFAPERLREWPGP